MGENIEVKDAQKTEYLDKNGLDMLWAKVKENTHNQVEAERNRAVGQETIIIETKADKSTLDNYVLTTALAEYAKKTDIPEIDTSDFVSKSDTITQTINSGLIAMDELQVFSKGYYDQTASLRGRIYVEGADTKLTLNDTTASHNRMVLTASKLAMSQDVGDNTLLITTSGIANTDNNADHVYATDGSIADLTQYAKKTELPTVPTKVSQLTNDSNFITAADVDFTPYATTEALQAETTARTEANAALENKIAAKQDKITPKTIGNYQVGSEDESLTTDNIKALRALVLDLKSVLVQSGLIVNSAV